jgi:hypothetical protein
MALLLLLLVKQKGQQLPQEILMKKAGVCSLISVI